MELFPNPARGQVNFSLSGVGEDASLTVADQLGRTVWTKRILPKQSRLQLDLSDPVFRSGLYFVSIVSNGTRITKRLVVTQ